MKKIILSLFVTVVTVLASSHAIAQKIEAQSSKYVRNGMSFHFVTPSGFSSGIVNAIKVPGKYDDNSFGDNSLNVNLPNLASDQNSKQKKGKANTSIEVEASSDEFKSIEQAVQQQKIANKILSNILLDENGKINFDKTIFKRGEYNATDKDAIQADASNKGWGKIRTDAITNVLNNVYLVVNQTGAITNSTSKDVTTYSVPFKSYLIQVDLSSLLSTFEFYDKFPLDKNITKELNDYKFNIKLLSVSTGSGSTTDQDIELNGLKVVKKPKTEQQIYVDLATSTVDQGIIDHANNYEALKVKTPVISTGPITAKIGKKEGLRIDDRFEVFENRMSEKTGEKSATRMGYVRVGKVGENESVADGNSEVSKFYKAPARRVDKNMILKEIPETGIQVGAEIAFGQSSYLATERYSYKIGNSTFYDEREVIKTKSVVMPLLNMDYVTHLLKGNRVGVSLAIKDGSPIALAEVKQVLQLNRLTFTPGVGYLYYLESEGDEPGGLSASFKMGLELGKNFQINLGPRFIADAVSGDINAYFGLGIRVFGF
jgi:hypothetical protein